jgi:hypothetical protein
MPVDFSMEVARESGFEGVEWVYNSFASVERARKLADQFDAKLLLEEIDNNPFLSDFYKNKDDACRWVGKLFFWEGSFLNQEYQFWDNIYMKWSDLVDSKRYNIEFSRYPIENWELIKPVETIKVKEKKLKI